MRILSKSVIFLAGVASLFAQAEAPLTPAQRSIAQAQQELKAKPGKADGYNSLAMALSRRARETSDPNYYRQGEDAVRKSLEVAPDNLGAFKARVWLLLGQHEFAKARLQAIELNKRAPDDVLVYGFLTDANVELGNYDEAEKACNWMLRLRPGNIPALTRAAYLRELYGDLDGAADAMTKAYQATPIAETEDRAWALTQLGHLKLMMGRAGDAAQLLERALAIFPGYHYALANLARVRIAQHRYEEAAGLMRRRYDAAPHPENLFDLAEALKLAGRTKEALEAFGRFENAALAESAGADNSNRELIYYYADHAGQPVKALELAEKEYMRRRDVYTLAAYAWALHVNGRDADARGPLEAALAVGVRDSKILEHARHIVPMGDSIIRGL